MMVYLWSEGHREGPMLLETVHSRLQYGVVPAGTLFCFGEGEDWKPLSELPALPRPPVLAAPGVDKWMMHVEQRSGWASALRVFGGLTIIGAFLAWLGQNAAGKDFPAIQFLAALGLGAGFFFAAFLVDVLTDIRWQLNQIRQRGER